MAGNSFGEVFRVTTYGESHGKSVGVIVDGCPAGMELDEDDIQHELDRRKPGQSHLTTPREEHDIIHIESGMFDGHTTGTPIMMMAHNTNTRSEDYNELSQLYRPSHADFTYEAKYGLRDPNGSGRASARETLARVAGGAIAQKFLTHHAITITSYVEQVGTIHSNIDPLAITRNDVDASLVRCPDPATSAKMQQLIEEVRADDDSIGGVIRTVVTGIPAGLGEPVFDRLSADLAKAMLSINATKGFEYGSGFEGVTMRGSEHNDPFVQNGDTVQTITNHSGGIQGGISNGMPILFRTAFKPVATIGKTQHTIDRNGQPVALNAKGRHDPCVLPRAVPVVDAMASLVITDHLLRQRVVRADRQ